MSPLRQLLLGTALGLALSVPWLVVADKDDQLRAANAQLAGVTETANDCVDLLDSCLDDLIACDHEHGREAEPTGSLHL